MESSTKKEIVLASIVGLLVVVLAVILYKRYKAGKQAANPNTTASAATGATAPASTPGLQSTPNPVTVEPHPRPGVNTPAPPIDWSKCNNAMIQVLFPCPDKDRLIKNYNLDPTSRDLFLDAYNVMWGQGEVQRKNLPEAIVNAWIQSHIDLDNVMKATDKLTMNMGATGIGNPANVSRLVGVYVTNYIAVVKQRAEQDKKNGNLVQSYVNYLNAALKVAVTVLPLLL